MVLAHLKMCFGSGFFFFSRLKWYEIKLQVYFYFFPLPYFETTASVSPDWLYFVAEAEFELIIFPPLPA